MYVVLHMFTVCKVIMFTLFCFVYFVTCKTSLFRYFECNMSAFGFYFYLVRTYNFFFYISAFNFITARLLLFIVQAIAFLKSPISVCPSNLKLYISSLKILSCYAC